METTRLRQRNANATPTKRRTIQESESTTKTSDLAPRETLGTRNESQPFLYKTRARDLYSIKSGVNEIAIRLMPRCPDTILSPPHREHKEERRPTAPRDGKLPAEPIQQILIGLAENENEAVSHPAVIGEWPRSELQRP